MAATTIVRYRGIRPTDPGGREGLRNPERGFRTETLIAEPVGRTEGVWGIPAHLWGRVGPGFSPTDWAMDIRRLAPDGVTLTQAYCYLTEWHDRPISREKLRRLQRSFDLMRDLGIKCVLRFAYVKDYPVATPPPDTARILRHMEQLKPLLARNADVIHTLEAGFLAAWGEWHVNAHITDAHDRAAILRKVLEIAPPGIFVQVRYPGIKTQLAPAISGHPYRALDERTAFTDTPEARVGHHDDGVLTHPRDQAEPIYAREPAEFGDLTGLVKAETQFVPMGGELFWSDMAWYGDGTYYKTFDGVEAATALRDYHFNLLSIAHSYSEREGKTLSIDRWRTQRITPEMLAKARLPVSRDWFADADGKQVERTAFDYIRDHLGYRLELQRLDYTATVAPGGEATLDLELINRGFSTLFHRRPVVFVLLDGAGKVIELPAADVDVRRWYPHRPGDADHRPLTHRIQWRAHLPPDLKPGAYSLGLWLPDGSERLRRRADYCIRVSNGDVPFWTTPDGRSGGINLLATLQVTTH